jgi:hypothetical protein
MTDSSVLIKRYGLSIPDENGVMRGSAWYLELTNTWLVVPKSFIMQDEWSNGFREVYVNAQEHAIFTYCEGDLSLTVDSDFNEWCGRWASAVLFYKTH